MDRNTNVTVGQRDDLGGVTWWVAACPQCGQEVWTTGPRAMRWAARHPIHDAVDPAPATLAARVLRELRALGS